MISPLWNGFVKIPEILDSEAQGRLEKVDGILAAAMEAIADALPTATAPLLREGSQLAKVALQKIEQTDTVDEASPSYVAGRLAAAVDVLGYAAHQTADSAILELAVIQPYARILATLAKTAMRNVDLARAIGKDEGRTSKWLSELRELGGITSHKRGRDVFNALTPVGRLVVEQGLQRHVPLEASEIYPLDGKPYDLSRRRPVAGAQPASLPRLNGANVKSAAAR